eukprot:CAMPEP_0206186746 /NCGR_PEP_ID=MMETSP0166-20121206/2581_1 /ASSEMBLY_ACC=CAM_ASM_000260 /TAXON_ID=95228 /ORGANISM="Vannella robusta, Strain DIVA3 518/3/11/1/6" /LENGTH=144 /DNA_ID=CAMNT_0053602179 /DNA_START=27 /DNA_END=461 /DNA_ORIENTATION=-
MAHNHESSLVVEASPDEVYKFVSDIKNMPKYMPTTKCAEKAGKERVHVAGEGDGFQYDTEGYLRRNNSDEGRLEWGSDEHAYKGWMKVEPHKGGSKVTIHLTFKEGEYDEIPCKHVTEGLEAGLKSIKQQTEGTGGKVKPPVEH